MLDPMADGSRPIDEWPEEVILPYSNGSSVWLIGRENYDDGQLISTAPPSAEEIVAKIEARGLRPSDLV